MSNDNDFLAVLGQCIDACADLDLSDDGWMPPVGEYDVELSDVQTGMGKKKPGAWIKPIFKIHDEVNEDLDGKTFTDYFFIVPDPDPNKFVEMAPLKHLAQLATCLAGREERDPVMCMGIINAAKGQEFLTIEVYETTSGPNSKKPGTVYKNIRYLSRLESTDEIVDEEVDSEEVTEEATA